MKKVIAIVLCALFLVLAIPVVSAQAAGHGGHSFVTLAKVKPAAPEISSIACTADGIKLTWNKVSGAGKYAIYRRLASESSFEKIDTVTGTSYTDKTVVSGESYRYSVCAVSPEGTSSDFAGGKTISYLAAPTITVEKVDDGVKISWSKVTGADKYSVLRKASGDSGFSLISATKDLEYVDATAEAGKEYRYTVSSASADGKVVSAYATGISITIEQPAEPEPEPSEEPEPSSEPEPESSQEPESSAEPVPESKPESKPEESAAPASSESESSEGGFPLWAIIVIAASVVVIALAVVLILVLSKLKKAKKNGEPKYSPYAQLPKVEPQIPVRKEENVPAPAQDEYYHASSNVDPYAPYNQQEQPPMDDMKTVSIFSDTQQQPAVPPVPPVPQPQPQPTPAPSVNEEIKFCPQCGMPLTPGTKFCKNCGFRIPQ